MDDIITTKEAAEVLEVSPESITRLLRLGKLKGERFGYMWMVYRESLEDYQKQIQGKSKHDPTRGKQD